MTLEFEIDAKTGRKSIKKHDQTLGSLGGEVIGAYAVMEFNDGTFDAEIMNIDQITASWKQGSAYRTDGSPAHKKFADQMAEKTVINRACKLLIRGSDDNILFAEPDTDPIKADMEHALETDANKEEISIEAETIEVEAETVDTLENVENAEKVQKPKKEDPKDEINIESKRETIVDKDGQVSIGDNQGPGF